MFTYTKKYLMPDWWKEKEMKRYPLIERCGLSAVNGSTFIPADEYYVRADELEAFLDKRAERGLNGYIKIEFELTENCEHEKVRLSEPQVRFEKPKFECLICRKSVTPTKWEAVE